MRAYKFLAAGRVGRFSDFHWPGPGEWVEAEGELRDCATGVHACRPADLLDWIDDELWEVELDGDVRESEGMVVARRGRLVRRVEGWTDAAAAELAEDCTRRARTHALRALRREGLTSAAEEIVAEIELKHVQTAVAAEVEGFAADAVALQHGHRPGAVDPGAAPAVLQAPAATAANVAYVVAHTAGRDAVGEAGDEDAYAAGFAAERAWQLAWLTERLALAS